MKWTTEDLRTSWHVVTMKNQTTILENTTNTFYSLLKTLRHIIMHFSGATVPSAGQNQALGVIGELSNLIPGPDLTIERWFKHFGNEKLFMRFGDNGHSVNELQEVPVVWKHSVFFVSTWKYQRCVITLVRPRVWEVKVRNNARL